MLTGVALPEDRNVIKKEAEKFLKYILKKLGWMVNASAWRPVPTVQVTGRATKPVWTGAENLASPPLRDSIPGPATPTAPTRLTILPWLR